MTGSTKKGSKGNRSQTQDLQITNLLRKPLDHQGLKAVKSFQRSFRFYFLANSSEEGEQCWTLYFACFSFEPFRWEPVKWLRRGNRSPWTGFETSSLGSLTFSQRGFFPEPRLTGSNICWVAGPEPGRELFVFFTFKNVISIQVKQQYGAMESFAAKGV